MQPDFRDWDLHVVMARHATNKSNPIALHDEIRMISMILLPVACQIGVANIEGQIHRLGAVWCWAWPS